MLHSFFFLTTTDCWQWSFTLLAACVPVVSVVAGCVKRTVPRRREAAYVKSNRRERPSSDPPIPMEKSIRVSVHCTADSKGSKEHSDYAGAAGATTKELPRRRSVIARTARALVAAATSPGHGRRKKRFRWQTTTSHTQSSALSLEHNNHPQHNNKNNVAGARSPRQLRPAQFRIRTEAPATITDKLSDAPASGTLAADLTTTTKATAVSPTAKTGDSLMLGATATTTKSQQWPSSSSPGAKSPMVSTTAATVTKTHTKTKTSQPTLTLSAYGEAMTGAPPRAKSPRRSPTKSPVPIVLVAKKTQTSKSCSRDQAENTTTDATTTTTSMGVASSAATKDTDKSNKEGKPENLLKTAAEQRSIHGDEAKRKDRSQRTQDKSRKSQPRNRRYRKSSS